MESIVQTTVGSPTAPKVRRFSKAGIAAAAAVLLIVNFVLYAKLKSVEIASENRQEMLGEQLLRLQETLAKQNYKSQRTIRQLEDQLNESRLRAGDTAKAEAKRESERMAKAISESQREQIEAVAVQLQSLHAGSDEVSARLNGVGREVDGVKSSFDQARTVQDMTTRQLDAAQMRLVALDDRIEANSSRMEELLRREAHETVRFRLSKQRSTSRVGGVHMRLTKTDPKRSKFSLEVLVDDKKLVKKDRQTHEPILLHLDGAARPHEIVVTRVLKDEVEGYVSFPVAELARR